MNSSFPTAPHPAALTFPAVLADRAKRLPDKRFLHHIEDGRAWTYAQWQGAVRRVAAGLGAAGVGKGEHVAVMLENCPEQLLAYFGLATFGAVTVPVNTAARGELLSYFLGHADCSAAIVDAALLPRLLDIAADLPRIRQVFVVGGAGIPAGVESHGKLVVRDFAELASCEAAMPASEPAFGDLAFLMYTSGTTGPSKAIMFTQAHALYWGWDYGQHQHYSADDTVYVYLPLFHGNGWLCSTLGALMADASVVLARRFSASRFWKDVVASGATVTNCLGAVASFLWAQPPSAQDRQHRLHRMGVSPVPEFGAAFEQRFGLRIMSAYGLTDYCMATAYDTSHPREKLGSAGRARRGIDIRIADEHDMPLAPGTAGEILLRSNNPWGASQGYYKMPEASLAARRNMWFHTGDRGYLDTDGFLYFQDRIKDAIRRRGENISAFEVERALMSHPAVHMAAAYAVRADATEDEVAVSVVLHPGAVLDEASLIDHCRHNLAYFMVPRYVELVPALPLNLSQKVEKFRLRERAQGRLGEMWDRVAAGIAIER